MTNGGFSAPAGKSNLANLCNIVPLHCEPYEGSMCKKYACPWCETASAFETFSSQQLAHSYPLRPYHVYSDLFLYAFNFFPHCRICIFCPGCTAALAGPAHFPVLKTCLCGLGRAIHLAASSVLSLKEPVPDTIVAPRRARVHDPLAAILCVVSRGWIWGACCFVLRRLFFI